MSNPGHSDLRTYGSYSTGPAALQHASGAAQSMPGVRCRANMEVMCMLMSYASACRRNLIAQQATLPACIILPDTGVKLALPLDYIHTRDFKVTEGSVVLALEMSQRCECFLPAQTTQSSILLGYAIAVYSVMPSLAIITELSTVSDAMESARAYACSTTATPALSSTTLS